MKGTKYTVKITTQLKKDYKPATKRGLKIALLEDIIAALATGEALPAPSALNEIYDRIRKVAQRQSREKNFKHPYVAEYSL